MTYVPGNVIPKKVYKSKHRKHISELEAEEAKLMEAGYITLKIPKEHANANTRRAIMSCISRNYEPPKGYIVRSRLVEGKSIMLYLEKAVNA